MATALLLIVLGALSRIVPHPPNAVAMGALSLYAGARCPRRGAWLIPVAAMVLSDLILDSTVYASYGRSLLGPVRLTSYATLALVALLGSLRREAGPATRVGMSAGASILFYATTNFAVWAADRGATYTA